MDTGGTGSKWELSAPESYILLHGPKGGPEGAEEAFKLALLELAARGWITTDEKSGGVEGETSEAQVDSLLARGETDLAPKQRPLVAALAIFEGALSEAGNPQEGIPAAEVRRFAEDRYGKLSAFAEEEVLSSLQERGYYAYSEDKVLGLIPPGRLQRDRGGWQGPTGVGADHRAGADELSRLGAARPGQGTLLSRYSWSGDATDAFAVPASCRNYRLWKRWCRRRRVGRFRRRLF